MLINTNNPISSYQHYQRATTKLLYSNTFFNNKLRTNSSFDFIYGKDQRERNPDDEQTKNSFGRPRYRFYFEYQWYMEYKIRAG